MFLSSSLVVSVIKVVVIVYNDAQFRIDCSKALFYKDNNMLLPMIS